MAATTDMMKPEPARTMVPIDPKIVESIVLRGDISGLSPAQKVQYANSLALAVGLDPATTPFKSIRFERKGVVKEVMYADKGTAEQLRMLHCVDIKVTNKEVVDGIYIVTVRATLPNGRGDEDIGAVPFADQNYADAKANAFMKAFTKAKRRATLSILGLGMLDESEIETVQVDRFANLRPEEQKQEPAPVARIAEKKSEALPPLPEVVDAIPPSILLGVARLRNAGLDGVLLRQMGNEDLELVADACGDFYKAAQANNKMSELGLKWLRAIIADATRLLDERANGGEVQS